MSGAVRGTTGLLCVEATCTECSEQVNCANTFRMGSSNSLFAIKSCACASGTSPGLWKLNGPVVTTVLCLQLKDHYHAHQLNVNISFHGIIVPEDKNI